MFTYHQAKRTAVQFVHQIKESCEQIEIVGSLRRLRPHVNDIDIVAVPKFTTTRDQTLFGDPVEENRLDTFIASLCNNNLFTLETNGPKIKRLRSKSNGSSIPIDIYVATAASWWTLKLIRTGSREHNILLARRAIEKHMVLKADGTGLLTAGGDVISIDSEEAVFQHLGMPYRRPEERD